MWFELKWHNIHITKKRRHCNQSIPCDVFSSWSKLMLFTSDFLFFYCFMSFSKKKKARQSRFLRSISNMRTGAKNHATKNKQTTLTATKRLNAARQSVKSDIKQRQTTNIKVFAMYFFWVVFRRRSQQSLLLLLLSVFFLFRLQTELQ